MPFERRRPALSLTAQQRRELEELARSRKASKQRVERARILLAYSAGTSVSELARICDTNRPKVERSIDKALQLGPIAALEDLPRTGRKWRITAEDRAWVVSLACCKPKDFGYSFELWTTRLLCEHIRKHCQAEGHPSLASISRGTVSKLLTKAKIRPHKINYYLERRDPEFDEKMAQVLCVYREVALIREQENTDSTLTAILSYDEKPGIQAIENTAPDLPPVPGGAHPYVSRDYEYVRHGTLTLMAAIDLVTGQVHGLVVERHRSREFIAFLKKLDAVYPSPARVRIVLDNHSAHVSKETRAYLATTPNRFEFVFTPKHGSWLNLVESFFGKLARTMLRGIRVSSKDELRKRLELFLEEVNASPVVYRWTAGLDSLSVV